MHLNEGIKLVESKVELVDVQRSIIIRCTSTHTIVYTSYSFVPLLFAASKCCYSFVPLLFAASKSCCHYVVITFVVLTMYLKLATFYHPLMVLIISNITGLCGGVVNAVFLSELQD